MNRRERMALEFHDDLRTAERCAQRALNALYAEDGPKRGLLFRMALGRAQSILMTLIQRELKRGDK